MLLEEYGYDDNVIAAGYLHDVVEDTKYILEDIKKMFGEDIANLVKGASEPDKSLSWMERKQHTINEISSLSFRNKLVICADKINNLEEFLLTSRKNGKPDFFNFNEGYELQKWYYTNVYKSLVYNDDESLPIFQRLKAAVDNVFYEKDNSFLKETVFADNKEYYSELKKLHDQKKEFQNLKKLCSLSKPFIIEFSGTPRTGKTTLINNLYDFFKKGGFDILYVEEFTTSKIYKSHFQPIFKKMGLKEGNFAILNEVYNQLQEVVNSHHEIILIDRSINDRQIWNHRRYIKGDIPEEEYLEVREKYSSISRKLIDYLVITYADALTSLKRDYQCHLALEERTFLNIDNLEEYNRNLNNLAELLQSSTKYHTSIDTSNMGMNDVSVEVASNVLSAMRKEYIKTFKQKYHLK